MKILKPIFILNLFLLTIIACKKTTVTPNNPEQTGTGTLYFHLHTNIDSTEVGYGDTARDASGRKIVLSLAQFYISGITAKRADGSTYTFNGIYLLKKTEDEVYTVGNSIPAGNYTSISFNIGIDSTANAKSPSLYSSNNVLSAQTPSMWFGSVSQGYIFMNIMGTVDTSLDKNGIANFPFRFQIGSNALLKRVSMPQQNYTVSANQDMFIHITCDYGKLFQDLDFKIQNNTNTYTTNPDLATQITSNIPLMFRYEE